MILPSMILWSSHYLRQVPDRSQFVNVERLESDRHPGDRERDRPLLGLQVCGPRHIAQSVRGEDFEARAIGENGEPLLTVACRSGGAVAVDDDLLFFAVVDDR